ncbi:MFS transporter [Streptomyces flavofungini]|uniref:MFS transporter n=1 Tax=Streptomyces flavofungini TaxID=68200 RepID=UPI0025B13576|nr:MFS transporter [Streptomyces flavofungini]WJV50703.1 MFS transporter [Streptomyces flavofungini]
MPHTVTTTAERPRAASRSPLIGWLAVWSVTAGLFAIVTVEILPIGLLPEIGHSFRVTDGTAGLTMTMPGFLAALSAPLVTTATARVDRRLMLCVFMALLALANFVAAVAPAYWLVLVSRVLVGVTIGGFWSIGAGLAARLVPPESVGRATAVIFSAVPLGSVLGVPLGTFVGEAAGWRTAFTAMGVLSLGVCGAMVLVLPPLAPDEALRVRVLRAALRGSGTRWALLVTFLVVLAHFGAYTYVTPFLRRVTDVGPGVVTVFLLVYGAAGIAGNFIGGAAVARRPRAAFAVAAGLVAGAALLLPVLGDRPGGAVVLLVVWGIGYGAVPVCSGAWFAAAVPRSPEAASVLFTGSFQATISLGALAGGAVVDRAAPSAVMVLGGLTAALAVVVAGLRR